MTKTNSNILFLGTGGSMGIPVVGCHCAVCKSLACVNKRNRPSVLLSVNEKNILIDAGPDFRTQALKHRIDRLDGIILTHAHNDHTAGIDDLRVFYMWTRKALPCLMSSDTACEIKSRYKYIFSPNPDQKGLVSKLSCEILDEDRGIKTFLGIPCRYFSFFQAGMKVTGFRFGDLGFVSDIKVYPETIFEDLAGVNTLVLSALRFESSYMHFSIDEALAFAAKVGAKKTWLTHIAHEIEHVSTNQLLPSNMSLAYDGLTVNFNVVQ